MKIELAYGKGALSLVLPPTIDARCLLPGRVPALRDPLAAAREALLRPVGTPPLVEMLRRSAPAEVVVVVNDVTRPTPYPVFFPPLFEAFAAAGIGDEQVTLLVATGIHAGHTERQNRETYGAEAARRFRIVSHDASDGAALRGLGALASGYELTVNSLACEADFLITLGIVTPHYFAGYSGGRKSILPGVAGRGTIERNHARMVELMDALPAVDENPVSLEMIDAARRVGVDFILNAVVDEEGEVVEIVAGDVVEAWRRAVRTSAAIYEAPFSAYADVCVVSAGGWPRDINAYQAQKALDHADRIVRPGGVIILVAECSEGYGEETFREWLSRGWPTSRVMEEIRREFVMGGHKAYGYAKVASNKEVFLLSAFDDRDTRRLYARKFPTLRDAVDAAVRKHGHASNWVVMPQGGVSLPVFGKR